MRRVSRLVVVVLVLSAPIAGAVVMDSETRADRQRLSDDRAAESAQEFDSTAQDVDSTTQEFDSTAFVITTYENGTATFTIRYERRLANETEVEQFETFGARFEDESTDLYDGFQSRARTLAATGRNETGREMTASAFHRDARVQERFNTLGIVEMSFQWSGFAPVRDDSRVVVGDVFEGGIYLGPNQAIVFQHGPELRFDGVDPDGSTSGDTLVTSDSVTWTGEREFADNRPRAVFVPASTNETTSTTTAGSDGGAGTDDGTDTGETTATTAGAGGGGPSDDDDATTGDGLGMLPMVVLAFVAVLVAAFAYREYGGDLVNTDDDGGTPNASTSTPDDGPTPTTTQSPPESARTDEPAVSDEELLTDEDRVLSLLDEHGGRMRQVNIVDQTGWSKSKVSMLLSDMEDEDAISKLRVGRENIISLEGHEPDVAGSPFDDEPDDSDT